MLETILKNENFIHTMQKHCYEVISHLIEENIEFSIVANTNFIDFNPELPKELDVKQNPYALFALGGYTFESIQLNKDFIQFHAGFGNDDFDSFVKVDLGAITQIQIENNILFVNFSLYKREDSKNLQKSKNIFLNNPKNKDIFKK
ncbi:hypothetical protein SFD15_000115 [Campylobacter jejuni]|uniref:hypothetical protein n=1 Tax=Campylobacter TaxID=194 RepID=UPI00015D03CC|nr:MULTISPECIES: hypothetical protein [Campylobacter]EFV11181.1 hypothetical protein CSU_0386 [Campylobacter jejuni subsp. jejuni 327]ABV52640.1 hypothetical protein C8J_1041 [Campylobacter jejuni subsp. jejuni 81116]ADN91272.1 Putative uncharacterized protein [Campylobacter jejuni subsp. jejuni M1]AII24803.1 hypothetical protein MTVDSCj20_1104 [Campylobacter jejuni subsp. jejuni]ALK81662.1 hypothetical protein CJM1cam_1077 [Campylobacter jejuni]